MKIIRYLKLIPVHPYCYKHKDYEKDIDYSNEGEITDVVNLKPSENHFRLCFEVTYPDGFKDYVPVSNVLKGYNQIVDTDGRVCKLDELL